MTSIQDIQPLPLPGITPDSISTPKVELSQLSSLSFDDLMERIVNGVVTLAINVALAIAVFYIGKFVINKIYKLVNGILLRRRIDKSLSTFVLSFVRMVLYFILIVTVIGILGIETSSFIAIFASAGVAVGMALSGTLQNFAGGVLILLLKPYKVGDYIETQGFAGYVTEIQIFHTIINTYDNKSIIIPNGGLSTGSVNNWSREDYRRVEWTVSISYGDDFARCRQAILDIFASDDRIVRQYIEDDRRMRREQEKEAHDKLVGSGEAEPEPEKRHSRLWRLFHRKMKERVDNLKAEAEESPNPAITVPKADRSPSVSLNAMADSSIEVKARAWTRSTDYWSLFYDINERLYAELPQQGIHFPFPQLDVHLSGSNASES